MTALKKYWLCVLSGLLVLLAYPIYMGLSVLLHMLQSGSVSEEAFPKYIIPYTPIAIAVLVAVLLLPLILKRVEKYPTLAACCLALCVFFPVEFLFEKRIIVTATVQTTLESWQMFMCAVQPTLFETRTWTAGDILRGEYSPAFKLHFYLIAVVLIVGIIRCIYGFGQQLGSGDRCKRRVLWAQTLCTALFLGLCILACFTAFYREGELTVSPLSAFLMCLFFVVMGVTGGTFTVSFFIGRKRRLSCHLPAATAGLLTLLMYFGEMILLHGNLYRFGTGFLFEGLPGIVLAPMDLLVILLSVCITEALCHGLNAGQKD